MNGQRTSLLLPVNQRPGLVFFSTSRSGREVGGNGARSRWPSALRTSTVGSCFGRSSSHSSPQTAAPTGPPAKSQSHTSLPALRACKPPRACRHRSGAARAHRGSPRDDELSSAVQPVDHSAAFLIASTHSSRELNGPSTGMWSSSNAYHPGSVTLNRSACSRGT
jgi:hypothetical protein